MIGIPLALLLLLITSIRSRLYEKVFGKKGGSRDWDDFILAL